MFLIVSISSVGKVPSSKLFNVFFDISNPAFRTNIATKIAIIGSKTGIPVTLIKTNPKSTPNDQKTSVLKCSPSACKETESDFSATLNKYELTKIFATTAKSITQIPSVVSTSTV